jgi:hypothetical protein
MDKQYQRLLDFIEIGPGGNRERFLVVFRGFYILARCVQSRDGKLVRVGSRALDSWSRVEKWKRADQHGRFA